MSTFGVLKNRNYAILFSGQIISKLGNNLYLLALPWYVYTVTGSKSSLAITGFLQSLPIVLGLFAGVFVDRWKKRTVMIVVDSLRVLIALALFLAVELHQPLWVIVVLVLILEAVGKFFSPAFGSIVPQVMSKEEIPAAQGLDQSAGALAQLVALFGGGVLMQAIGPADLFLGNAIGLLVSAISLSFIRLTEVIQLPEKSSFIGEWLEGLRLSFLSRRILLIVMAAMITNFAFAAFDITITAWVKGPMQGNAVTLGSFGAAVFLGIIVGGLLLGAISKRFKMKAILVVGLLASGFLVTLLGLYTRLSWDLPVIFIMGIFNGLMNGSVGTMLVNLVPAHARGRVFGTLGALGSIMTPMGLAVYGWLLTWIAIPDVFVYIGLPVLISGLSLLLPVKDDTNRLTEAAEAI